MRDLRLPPTDHPHFELPVYPAADKAARMRALASSIEYFQNYYGPLADDDGMARQ
ncbi:MAG: hypothetical protein ABWY05_02040 [Noviherbaspirillum sp.]